MGKRSSWLRRESFRALDLCERSPIGNISVMGNVIRNNSMNDIKTIEWDNEWMNGFWSHRPLFTTFCSIPVLLSHSLGPSLS